MRGGKGGMTEGRKDKEEEGREGGMERCGITDRCCRSSCSKSLSKIFAEKL